MTVFLPGKIFFPPVSRTGRFVKSAAARDSPIRKTKSENHFSLTGTVLKSRFEFPDYFFFLPHSFPLIPDFSCGANFDRELILLITLMAGYLSSSDVIRAKYVKIINTDLTNMNIGTILRKKTKRENLIRAALFY